MSNRTRRARLLGVVGAVLLAAGVIALAIAVVAQRSAPQPPASAATPVDVVPSVAPATVPGPGTGSMTAGRSGTRGPLLQRSAPTRISIPSIGVNGVLGTIGLDRTGQIETPPLGKDSHAYWLDVSPTPGELGPATIIGHVDSAANGPGVFFRLGDLRQRDVIDVSRTDGTTATFEVERVAEYKKASFPTQEVYGNIDHAGLRLITCGGSFDSSARSYESNIVVYASLVSVRRA